MPIGYVNTDYIIFIIENDPETIKEKIEELAYSIRLEYRIKNGEDNIWDF
jgi:hypothetical protein